MVGETEKRERSSRTWQNGSGLRAGGWGARTESVYLFDVLLHSGSVLLPAPLSLFRTADESPKVTGSGATVDRRKRREEWLWERRGRVSTGQGG